MTAKKITETVGIIGPCRLSYLNVFQPAFNKLRKEDEYSCTLLIPKKPTKQCPQPGEILNTIKALSEGALIQRFRQLPKKYDPRLLDGDTETDTEGNAKYPGYYFVSCRSTVDKPAPVLLDRARNPVLDANAYVSGDWGIAKVAFYAYEYQGTKGVGAGLRAIQFTHKDEPFGDFQTPEQVAAEFDILGESSGTDIL